MNRILLKTLAEMQQIHASMRSVHLKDLASELLQHIDDSVTEINHIQRPGAMLYSPGYDFGLIDHDLPLEILEDLGSGDPYNTI